MSKHKSKDTQKQGQAQGEAQGQLQGQAELQAQAQGQLELQAQGQGQDQGQGQSQYQSAGQTVGQAAFALNVNDNKNENENENKNENTNKIDNEVENKVESRVDNKVENKVENSVENNVEVKVDVNVDLDIDGSLLTPSDDDVIDIDSIHHISDSIVMPDVVTQSLKGDGNIFNIDQVNNLADQDCVFGASVSFGAKNPFEDIEFDGKGAEGSISGATFQMWATAEGGHAKADDIETKVGNNGNIENAGVTTADGIVSQEAFTQNIVLGSNIQFNQIDLTVAGNNLEIDDSL